MGQLNREEGGVTNGSQLIFPWGKAEDALLGEITFRAFHLGPQDCSNSLWALAVFFGQCDSREHSSPNAFAMEPGSWLIVRTCIKALLIQAAHTRGEASPQHLCNTLWAASKLLPPLRSPEFNISEDNADAEDDRHIIRTGQITSPQPAAGFRSILNGRSRKEVRGKDGDVYHVEVQLLQIASELSVSLGQCKPQELANVAVGCARLGLILPGPRPTSEHTHGRPGWWPCFWAASFAALPSSEPRHLAAMLWSAAAMGKVPPSRWTRALLREATGRSSTPLSPRAVASILWSLGKLGLLGPLSRECPGALIRLMDKAREYSLSGAFNPQGLMMTLKAAACIVTSTKDRQNSGGTERFDGGRPDGRCPDESRAFGNDLECHRLLQEVLPEAVVALRNAFLSCDNLTLIKPRALVSGLVALVALQDGPWSHNSKQIMNESASQSLCLICAVNGALIELEPYSAVVIKACLKRLCFTYV